MFHLLSVLKRQCLLSHQTFHKMNNLSTVTYEAALETLNNLQSNSNYLKNATKNLLSSKQSEVTIEQVRKYVKRVGLTSEDLDCLSVIHVAGTKGKGSTCALCENILRRHGFKTGLYTSPHLVEVRERIQINGEPISKDDFAKVFFYIFDKLDKAKENLTDLPLYFRFLTVMAFHYFIKEKVDVAILEVGIGGEYDCTNILRTVPVVGISSLGIDHTNILGETLEEIAWQKAGIMKKNCEAFTVPQPDNALDVLRKRSTEIGCNLTVVNPQLHSLNRTDPYNVFNLNSSLATALAKAWVEHYNKVNSKNHILSPDIVDNVVQNFAWPGRFEVRQVSNVRCFLDGAHTLESIEVCSQWFRNNTCNSENKKVLMFNVTGGRNAQPLFKDLMKCKFKVVLFVPNVASIDDDVVNKNNKDVAFPANEQMIKCEHYKKLWLELEAEGDESSRCERVEVFPSVYEGFCTLKNGQYDLLVTGSLHLVGAVLTVLSVINNDLRSLQGLQ